MGDGVPQAEILRTLAEEEEGTTVPSHEADSPTGIDLPLTERAQLSLNDHSFNIILNHTK
jgi:hypothetical protein